MSFYINNELYQVSQKNKTKQKNKNKNKKKKPIIGWGYISRTKEILKR